MGARPWPRRRPCDMDVNDEVRSAHEDRPLAAPGVIGVGVGKEGGRDVVLVFVTELGPGNDSPAKLGLPAQLDGFPVLVQRSATLPPGNSAPTAQRLSIIAWREGELPATATAVAAIYDSRGEGRPSVCLRCLASVQSGLIGCGSTTLW